MSEWTVRVRADTLKPGDKFIFAEDLGGEGNVLTVEGVASLFGTLTIATEELDWEIDLMDGQMVTVVDDPKQDPKVPKPLSPGGEYVERRDRLARFLLDLVYGEGAWNEADADRHLNYRLDADDIIKANPHLLSLEERERLDKYHPELALERKQDG